MHFIVSMVSSLSQSWRDRSYFIAYAKVMEDFFYREIDPIVEIYFQLLMVNFIYILFYKVVSS